MNPRTCAILFTEYYHERSKETIFNNYFSSGKCTSPKRSITTLCTVYPEKRTGLIIIVNDGSSEQRLFDWEKMLMKAIFP